MMGASTGRSGGLNAQRQLRDALKFPRAHVLEDPVVAVALAFEAFDDGRLASDGVRAQIGELLDALAATPTGRATAAAQVA